MSIADDIVGILPALREEAESLMLDEGTARRPGPTSMDPVTGVVAPTMTPVYSGRCKLQGASTLASTVMAGAHQSIIENLQLHFPVGSALQIDDVHILTGSAMNPDNAGLAFRLVEQDKGTLRTADRWNVELVVK